MFAQSRIQTDAVVPDLKPARISYQDVERPARTFLQALTASLPYYSQLTAEVLAKNGLTVAKERGYLEMANSQVSLLRIEADRLPDNLVQESLDCPLVREGMSLHGVIGNPQNNFPTYISRSGWCGESYVWNNPEHKHEDRIVVRIDTAKLCRLRSVFVDPESINEDSYRADDLCELGKMFFVLGGIPREAITKIEYPWRVAAAQDSSWGLINDK